MHVSGIERRISRRATKTEQKAGERVRRSESEEALGRRSKKEERGSRTRDSEQQEREYKGVRGGPTARDASRSPGNRAREREECLSVRNPDAGQQGCA